MSEETKDAATRIAEIREARAKAWSDLEAESLELEAKYEEELGARGSEFEIVMPANVSQVKDGILVVKRPERAKWNTFQESKMGSVEAHHLVLASLANPAEKDRFNELAKSRPLFVTRCATAIAKLVGLELQAEAGK